MRLSFKRIGRYATRQKRLRFFSEFFHLAPKPLGEESRMVGVPFIEMMNANPLAVRIAILTDIDRSGILALVIAANVSHSWPVGVPHPSEITVRRDLIPRDVANLAPDQFRQTGAKIIG